MGKIYEDGQAVELTLAEKCLYFDTRQDLNCNWSPGKGSWLLAQNYTAAPEDFLDVEWGRPVVREDSPAFGYGFTPIDLEDIGLQAEGRQHCPPKVFTALQYPYQGVEQPLTLGIRNFGEETVSGYLFFTSTNPAVVLPSAPLFFSVEAGEEQWQVVGALSGEKVFCVEVRSDTLGVRPARAENIEGSWKRL